MADKPFRTIDEQISILVQEDRTVRPYGNFKQVSAYTSGERVYLSSVSR